MNFLNNGLLLNPNRLCPDTPAWTGHIPFAGWLITALKPSVFVELGTHKGVSYSAFCQAVIENDLSTKCYAVDTWMGDEHAHSYDESVYVEYSLYHQNHFAAFSQLLRMTFDEALPYFSDKSIDLLHIDGLHTYDAVKHDFETWLPKMSTKGIILFHDINVRECNFGVWKLWEELSLQYPSVEFNHSYGLGMLVVGQDIPEKINDFLQNGQWAISKLFPHLAQLPCLKNKEMVLSKTLNVYEQQISELNLAVSKLKLIIAEHNRFMDSFGSAAQIFIRKKRNSFNSRSV